jgi:hypothetical protein
MLRPQRLTFLNPSFRPLIRIIRADLRTEQFAVPLFDVPLFDVPLFDVPLFAVRSS